MSEKALRLDLHESVDVAGLIDGWESLAHDRSAPYALPGWVIPWWTSGRDGRLRIVSVHEGTKLVGLAPFFSETSPLGGTRIRLLGGGTSSSVDLLGRPGDAEGLADALMDVLRDAEPALDFVLFDGVPASSPWPSALAGGLGDHCSGIRNAVEMPAPYVPLDPEGFDAWFAGKSSHFRARMRRSLRKLEGMGGRLWLGNADETEHLTARFIELHHGRWERRGGSGVLTPRVEAMLRQVAATAPGWLRLWATEVDGRVVSVQVFLIAGGVSSYWLGGLDESITQLRPGPAILSVLKEVELAHESGLERVDLGSGAQPFKWEFTDMAETLTWTTIGLRTARGRMTMMPYAGMEARMVAANRLSPAAKKRIRSLRSGITDRFRRN